jgi:hypothetical protein
LAKKLKEKGFDCNEPFAMYNELGIFHPLYTSCDETLENCIFGNRGYYDYDDFDEYDCVCPTISQVLKWLREEKKIHICIDIYDDGWFFDIASFYKGDTGVYEIEWSYKSSNVTPNYDSFEQAAIAGIEYCLDNLILL